MKKHITAAIIVIVSLIPLIASSKTVYISTEPRPVLKQVKIVEIKEYDPLFERICLAESGNRAHVKNPKSSASGRCQIVKRTWEGWAKGLYGDKWVEKDVFNYDHNTAVAYYGFKKEGYIPWCASVHDWHTNQKQLDVCAKIMAKFVNN